MPLADVGMIGEGGSQREINPLPHRKWKRFNMKGWELAGIDPLPLRKWKWVVVDKNVILGQDAGRVREGIHGF